MRHLLLPALFLSTALPAAAQERSLWDLIHPDQLVGQIVRSGVLALRSQMDVRYSNLAVSVASGTLSAEDVSLTLYENMTGGPECDISFAGLEIFAGDPFELDRIEATISVQGLQADPACLPPQAAPMLGIVGLTEVALPEVTFDITYDMPTAAATLRMQSAVDGAAAVQLDMDMAYVTLLAGEDGETSLNVDLSAASVTLEDLGAWTRVQPVLPPQFTNPETASAAVTQMLGQIFAGMTTGGPVPKSAKTFVTEAAQGWTDFVAEPGRLVVETGYAPADPATLTSDNFEKGPLGLIEVLQPVVRRVPAAERNALPADLVARALSAPDALSADDRRQVGLALLRGEGAPRAVGLGTDLLRGLAQDGDGEVALSMAEALEASDPEAAYVAALTAGGTGVAGVRGALDRIEKDLPFATRLRLQARGAPEPTAADLAAPARELAARAQAHFTGVNASRSLRHALLYASLAAARGDGGAARLMERIDRSIPDDGRTPWREVEAEVAGTALDAWISADRK